MDNFKFLKIFFLSCVLFALFTLFAGIAFSQAITVNPVNCDNGYADKFTVRAFDAKERYIPDALVQVTYDRGVTHGPVYFTTPPKPTDSEGKISFEISNGGTNTRKLDCNIVINGTAGWSYAKLNVFAKQHSSEIWLKFPEVYPVFFFVKDNRGVVLAEAPVTLQNITAKTDKNGHARFFARKGEYEYFVNFAEGTYAGKVIVSDDTHTDVVIKKYAVTISVVDENGKPLSAKFHISNKTYELPNGSYQSPDQYGENIFYTVEHEGIIQENTLIPELKNSVRVVFDKSSPAINGVSTSLQGNRVKLAFTLNDAGEYASGLNLSSLRVSYRFEKSDVNTPWADAVTYPSSKSAFISEFPEFPQNSIVQFRIEVLDYGGNKALQEGKFTTYQQGSVENNSTNNSSNPNTPPSGGGTKSKDGDVPLPVILIGLVVVFIVVFFLFKMKGASTE